VTRVRVVGVGNLDAGDDAIGLLAVRAARPALEALGVEVVETGAGVHVVDLLAGADLVVVVDAVREPRGERPPGTIVRAEAGPQGLPAELGSSLSSHGFGVAEAVGLAAALDGAPRVVVLGVEVADVVAGHGLSPPVRAALPPLTDRIVAEASVRSGLDPSA
jgi:hydrogenase maturation protease